MHLQLCFFLMLSLFMISTPVNTEPHEIFCQYNSAINYTLESPFGNNLKHLLESLSSNTHLRKGFNNTSIGDDSNRVYGQALCRGDIKPKICKTCVENASQEIMEECESEDAIIWHEFCQIQYSYRMFFSMLVYNGKYPKSNEQEKNVSDPGHFSVVLMSFMRNLADKAAFDYSKLMFATGKMKISRTETIYGLAQCTRDLSPNDCRFCLNQALGDIEACCKFLQGGIVFSENCNVRFQMYQFFNEPTVNGDKWKIWVPVAVIMPTFFLLAVLIRCHILRHGRKKWGTEEDEEKSQSGMLHVLRNPTGVVISQEGELVGSQELPLMELATIMAATDNFSDSNKLGQGGFGSVYKGVLPNGKEIAVKRLSRRSWQGIEEFKNEVILIAKLQHRNLVRLVGCGTQGEEKLLAYEYMPNKSLDIFIFDSEKRSQLDWGMRQNIIIGIARGLLYLHEDSRLKIIHRDLKPSNVLLDHEMVAKISDFGMARIFAENQNIANTKRVVGTYGYMAPEYAMEGLHSVKSDVFSFGVILLEIISGNRNSGFYLTGHAQTLLAYAWQLWNEGREMEFVDPSLTESLPRVEAVRYIHIGLLCVQGDPADRPSMSSVVALLGNELLALPEPRQPSFSVGRAANNSTLSSEADPSTSQITFSTMLPR